MKGCPEMKAIFNERASAYLWVVTIMLVLLLLSGMFLYLTGSDARIAYSFASGVRAYYLAESGAEYQVNRLYPQLLNVARPERLPSLNVSGDRHDKPFAPAYSVDHSYTVSASGPDPLYRYTIDSAGVYQKSARRVRVVLKVTFSNGASAVAIEEWKQY